MLRTVLNDDHLSGALAEALGSCRHRLFIATADVKDLHLAELPRGPVALGAPSDGAGPLKEHATHGGAALSAGAAPRRWGSRRGRSILEAFAVLGRRGVETRLLHSGVPSSAFLAELKSTGLPAGLTMRRCVRVHAKAVIADGRRMYLGSANLTGAGLGAKSPRRRNFEAGIWTDELALIDPVLDMLDGIWSGEQCASCGRRDYCPEPLEEPRL